MAISDPRSSGRSRESGQAGYGAEEDPLVELARIVSEDSGFSGRRTERAQPRRPEPVGRGQSPSELEAELLRELKSTFAAQSAPTPAPRPTPVASMRPAQAAPAQPAPQSQTPQPQRPQAAAPFDLVRTEPALEPAPVVRRPQARRPPSGPPSKLILLEGRLRKCFAPSRSSSASSSGARGRLRQPGRRGVRTGLRGVRRGKRMLPRNGGRSAVAATARPERPATAADPPANRCRGKRLGLPLSRPGPRRIPRTGARS